MPNGLEADIVARDATMAVATLQLESALELAEGARGRDGMLEWLNEQLAARGVRIEDR